MRRAARSWWRRPPSCWPPVAAVTTAIGSDPGIQSTACSPTTSGGDGTPRHLVVLVAPLQNTAADHGIQNAQAVKLVLAQRGWRAGGDTVALQVCDEASADEVADGPRCERIAGAAGETAGVIAVLGPDALEMRRPHAADPEPCARRTDRAAGHRQHLPRAHPGRPRSRRGRPGTLYPTGGRNYLRIAPADDVRAPPRSSPRARPAHGGSSPSTTARRTVAASRRAFIEAARRAGLESIGPEPWDPEASTYRELAARIARTTPDAVFLGRQQRRATVAASSATARRTREATSVLYAPDGFSLATELVEGAGERAEGLTVSLSAAASSALPRRGREWAAEFARRYGSRPCCYAVHAAQVTELVLDAIERSDGTRAGVLDKLQCTRGRPTASSEASASTRSATRRCGAISLHRIEGGRLRYLRTIEVPEALLAR